MSPESGGDDKAMQALASQILLGLNGAVSQAQLYEAENKILAEPIRRLTAQMREVFHVLPTFIVQSRDQSVFVNDQRLRCDGPTFIRHQQFFRLLDTRKASGLDFHAAPDEAQWTALLRILARADKSKATVFDDVRAALADAKIVAVVDLLPRIELTAHGGGGGVTGAGGGGLGAGGGEITGAGGDSGSGGGTGTGTGGTATRRGPIVGPGGGKPGRMERRKFAWRSFAKAVFLLKEYLRQPLDSPKRGQYHLKLQRVAHDLISVCEEGSWKHVGVVHGKTADDYLFIHSVNVTMLALVAARRLNLKRPRLAELAMAALMHDVGKAQLPAHLMGKAGTFTDADRKQLDAHPELGLRSLLNVKPYNEALLKRIMVICEHHQAATEQSDHHPFSRSVAVACTYDALTSDRPYRQAYRPDAAIRILHKMSDTKLDRGMVELFIQSLGLYPCGSVVELSDKSLAIAVEPNALPAKWRQPVVRIVQDPAGMRYMKAPLTDLAEAPERTVVRTLDPVDAGINPGAVLYEEWPKK